MAYIGNKPGSYSQIETAETRERLVSGAGQTVFVTQGYEVSNLKVFLNGVLLDEGDYTAIDGTNITLASAANLNDKLTYISERTWTPSAALLGVAVPVSSVTGSAKLPKGTSAQRDGSPGEGYIRYNTENVKYEGYKPSFGWVNFYDSTSQSFVLNGSVSGATTLVAQATASGTITFPAETGTVLTTATAIAAKTNTVQTWTAEQKTNELTDNDGVFDLAAGYNDFKCTPTGAITLTFNNIPATPVVQKGSLILVNSGQAVSLHANTKASSTFLSKVSAAGTYWISYRSSNGVVYVSTSEGLV